MIINTQINLDHGTKTSNTICVKDSQGKRKKLTKKEKSERSKQERQKLSQLSRALKKVQKEKIERANTEDEAIYLSSLTTNEILLDHYKKQTGAKEFHTFKQWKEKGFIVNRGEASFRFWATPLRARGESDVNKTDNTESNNNYFPTCCVFSDKQVAKVNDTHNQNNHGTTLNEASQKQPFEKYQPEKNIKLAKRLTQLAESMQKKIDYAFSDRLENTPKRIAQTAKARQEGYKLKRTKKALIALSALHSKGLVPSCLNIIKTKKQVYDLLSLKSREVINGYHSYYVETDERVYQSDEAVALWALLDNDQDAVNTIDEEEKKQKINDLKFAKIPGYFPTPSKIVDKMIQLANIHSHHTILEPSAGSGDILDGISKSYPNLDIRAYEINGRLYEIASSKYQNVFHSDFMQEEPKFLVDRILMNPPFEKLQDVDHIQHAFRFLKKGGVLVAIMSPSAFFRQDKKSKQFRDWFHLFDGFEEDLPERSFKSSGTNVNCKLIVIEKPINQ